jgi:hypothetical protein
VAATGVMADVLRTRAWVGVAREDWRWLTTRIMPSTRLAITASVPNSPKASHNL